jgi:hypothetical protein
VLGVHVLAGLGCVLTGLAAMVARKGPGRHAYFGTLYYRCLLISYILLLTAFYVDNGAHLPLWRELPTLVYWLLPAVIGIPLIMVQLWWHPLARAERRRADMISPRGR